MSMVLLIVVVFGLSHIQWSIAQGVYLIFVVVVAGDRAIPFCILFLVASSAVDNILTLLHRSLLDHACS